MNVQPIGNTVSWLSNGFSSGRSGTCATGCSFAANNIGKSDYPSSGGNSAKLALISEKYSWENLGVQYTNTDGDTISLSVNSVEYQKAILAASENASPEDWKKIIDAIKNEYASMKGQIVATMVNSDGEGEGKVEDPMAFNESKEIPGLPEYWNAENTSQRIVDFATSFFGMFEGKGDEYVAMIKDAIEEGFSQAKDIFGAMPDTVGKLVDKTHALVTRKIDSWAKDQGIDNAESAAEALS